MTPLGFVNKSGTLIHKGHLVRSGNAYSPRAAIVSQDDTIDASLAPMSRERAMKVSPHLRASNPILVLSNFLSESLPLRC
jgi:hypothetical protein